MMGINSNRNWSHCVHSIHQCCLTTAENVHYPIDLDGVVLWVVATRLLVLDVKEKKVPKKNNFSSLIDLWNCFCTNNL